MDMELMIDSNSVVGIIGDVPWIKFIPILIPTGVALWEIFRDKKKRGWFHRRAVPVLTVIATLAACWIVWDDGNDAKKSANELQSAKLEAGKWQKQAAEWQAKASTQLDRVEGKLGNADATRRYVEAVAVLTRQLTEAKTDSAVDKFFESRSEREELRTAVTQTNSKLLATQQIRLHPIRDFVSSKFDSWMNAARKRGIDVNVISNELSAVGIDGGPGGPIRMARFGNGYEIRVTISAAVIRDGKFGGQLLISIALTDRGGNVSGLWEMEVFERVYRLRNQRPSRVAFGPYDGDSTNPIEDAKLIESMNNSLDEVLAFGLLEATSSN